MFFVKYIKFISLTILFLFLLFNLTNLGIIHHSFANYSDNIASSLSSDTKDILNNIELLDPQSPTKIKLESIGGDITSIQDGLVNDFNTKSKEFTISVDDNSIGVSLPVNDTFNDISFDKDKIIFSSKNEEYDLIVENIDGGVRNIINIDSINSPDSYIFNLDLSYNDYIEKQPDGGVMIKNSLGEIKSVILKPWAKDSNGIDLNTYYEINGTNLVQKIDMNNAVFPVIADPIFCSKFYDSIEWVNRPTEGGLTLSIAPNWCGRNLSLNPWNIKSVFENKVRWDAPYHNDWNWGDRNTSSGKYKSLYKQFYCHADIAFWKSRWNIEPWRSEKSWWATYNSKQSDGNIIPCNPN